MATGIALRVRLLRNPLPDEPDLGPAPARHRPLGNGAERPDRLDARARLPLDPADAGEHELVVGDRSGRVSAGQLHEGAAFVRAAG